MAFRRGGSPRKGFRVQRRSLRIILKFLEAFYQKAYWTQPETQPWVKQITVAYKEHKKHDSLRRPFKGQLYAFLQTGQVSKCLEAEEETRNVGAMDKDERLDDLVEFPEVVDGFLTHKE